MGEVRVLGPADDAQFREFIEGQANASVYHTADWRDLLSTTYGYEPMYLAHGEGGAIRAVLPMMLVDSRLTGKRLVSLPFSNVCGPAGAPESFGPLIDRALEIYGEVGASTLEIRTQADRFEPGDERFSNQSYFITSLLDLNPDPEKIWKGFKDKNVRTEVRQAKKKGIEVRRGESIDDLKLFYDLFAPTRLKHGVPPTPFKFFRNMWEIMWPERLTLFLATHGDLTVGAFITLGFGETLVAAYIGSDARFRSYRVHQAMLWEALEMGCLAGFKRFDWLRTPRNADSLRYFKIRWNSYEVDLNYLYYPEVKGTAGTVEESAKYRLMTSLVKRSPDFVGKAIGRLIYKHLG
jgi:CelD/BcsL family acetyltransferase involved in cellulose biosynthesis